MLQVQTEYAYRPYPRITTTILTEGQVLHKVEKKLEAVISSIEEQNQTEDVMKKQHREVLSLINEPVHTKRPPDDEPTVMQKGPITTPNPEPPPVKPEPEPDSAPGSMILPDPEPVPREPEYPSIRPRSREDVGRPIPESQPTFNQVPAPEELPRPLPVLPEELKDKFGEIPDFEHAFVVSVEGKFRTEAGEKEFKRRFREVYEGLEDVLNVFGLIKGNPARREEGVVEVERNRLFLASSGDQMFFVAVRPGHTGENYEKAIKAILFPDELVLFLQQKMTQ